MFMNEICLRVVVRVLPIVPPLGGVVESLSLLHHLKTSDRHSPIRSYRYTVAYVSVTIQKCTEVPHAPKMWAAFPF
jgi:hypothetical protein